MPSNSRDAFSSVPSRFRFLSDLRQMGRHLFIARQKNVSDVNDEVDTAADVSIPSAPSLFLLSDPPWHRVADAGAGTFQHFGPATLAPVAAVTALGKFEVPDEDLVIRSANLADKSFSAPSSSMPEAASINSLAGAGSVTLAAALPAAGAVPVGSSAPNPNVVSPSNAGGYPSILEAIASGAAVQTNAVACCGTCGYVNCPLRPLELEAGSILSSNGQLPGAAVGRPPASPRRSLVAPRPVFLPTVGS